MNKELEVNIDFSESSKEWRSNKKQINNCMFMYKCCNRGCKSNICKNGNMYDSVIVSLKKDTNNIYCVKHFYKNS